MFKKKFKVRVRRYCENYYIVEYAYYRFFRWWYEIRYWLDPLSVWDTDGWSPVIFEKYRKAEDFARQLDTYDDIFKHYGEQLEKVEAFKKRRKEYFEKEIPYDIKIIK